MGGATSGEGVGVGRAVDGARTVLCGGSTLTEEIQIAFELDDKGMVGRQCTSGEGVGVGRAVDGARTVLCGGSTLTEEIQIAFELDDKAW